ncbi:hypothetical protein QBZ16_003527 [Prototheca wickerhamii]|uniref:Replication protein A subunit n=1 Tax=Prototheca wickerhamii TaxID=3111 RepID=A0AAD9IMH3_PROWI|nr:hypothetical protein QBZ16_003527 [Prototheca wickerhamii]
MQLTPGAIAGILSDGPPQVYTVQCTGIKKVMNPNGQPRYRLMLSDGVHQYVCMLASQLSELVATQLKENCILQILEYICQFVQTKKVVIVLNCQVVAEDSPRIGNPVMFADPNVIGASSAGAAGPAAQVGAPAGGYGGAAPPAGAGGAYGMAAPVPPAYGAAPPQQAYGGQAAPAGAYGAPPGAYGAPPATNAAYGAPPAQTGSYGAQTGAYAAQAPPQAAPYGAPQQRAPGYGAQAEAHAAPFGAPPPKAYGAPSAGPYGAVQPKMEAGGYNGSVQAAPGSIPAAYPSAGRPYGGGQAPAQPPQYRGSGPVVRDEGPVSIMPINSLNSYQNRWTIKARVTQKSDIRRYTNARGEGKFFSFDLLDAQGGEIRVVGWNDQVDRWFGKVEVGKVYMLSKASLRNKRGNFNQTRHQFEIHLENGTKIDEVADEPDIPQLHFNFCQIAQMEDVPAGQMVDVIGLVESVADWASITKRDGGETQKRSVVIRDETNRSVEVTLWGGYALDPGDRLQAAASAGGHPVLAVKNARVGDFNGKTLSTVSSSTVLVDPADVPEAARLRAWGLGLGGSPAWVSVVATISFLRNENMYYPACPLPFNGKTCNKKLQDHAGDGSWYCERCAQSAAPDWRYIVSAQVADHTGEAWVTAFNEAAPDILGLPAGELRALCEAGDPRFAFYVQQACFKTYLMRLKLAEDTYNDETRLRISLVSAAPLDFAGESAQLVGLIDKLRRGERVFEKGAATTATTGARGAVGYGQANHAAGAPGGAYGGNASYGGHNGANYGGNAPYGGGGALYAGGAPYGGAGAGGGYGAAASPAGYGGAPPAAASYGRW